MLVPTLLIIEDDVSVAKLLAKHFEKLGYVVRVAVSGEAGLAAIAVALPDAILCDLGLPGISGVAVIEAVRAEGRTSKLPVVVISARTHVQDHALALEAGADAYFDKPLKLKALEAELDKLLGNAR